MFCFFLIIISDGASSCLELIPSRYCAKSREGGEIASIITFLYIILRLPKGA